MRWTLFVAGWTTGMAYGFSTIYYQAATWATHPATSAVWIGACLAALTVTFLFLRHQGRNEAPALPVPQKA